MGTSKKSTGTQSQDQTLFAADILASHSAKQANAKANKTHDTSGHGYAKPLADYDPDTQSWKMYGDTYLWGDSPLLENLPPSGMTQNGVLYQQPAWAPITDAIESSSWPTPTAVTRPMEGNVRLYRAKVQAGEMTEAEAEAMLGKSVWASQGAIPAMWPTPTTQEVEHPQAELTETGRRKSKNGKSSHSLGLADAVKMWPTPTVDDSKNVNPKANRIAGLVATVNKWPTPVASDAWTGSLRSTQQTEGSRHSLNLPSAVGGKLNPTWVEWLMGFPTGWTDLEDSETQ